jgi:DNA repair protein RadD
MPLRDFQVAARDAIYAAWAEPNVFNVMPVIATGGGKTVLFCDIIANYQRPSVVIAHRQELVAQASLSLNRERVPHAILAPKPVQKQIIELHHETHGYSSYAYRSEVKVAGVDTLVNHDKADRWLSQVGLVVQDEGHHVLKQNKWGSAMALFPSARGLFPTAHALRADGQGLGRDADGLVDRLVRGPSCRELITRGFLTDYNVLCPQSDIDFSSVPVSGTGDLSLPKLRAVTHASNRIVGDVVRHYLKHAPGKLGVTFAVDIESALEIANAFNAAGVPAKVITSKTPITERGHLMRLFRARALLQLVSVDCLGEGVDVPAIEVISMARKTVSFQLFAQQFGRSLRPMLTDAQQAAWNSFTDAERRAQIACSQKPVALIIDHVGNYIYFASKGNLVDMPQEYDLTGAPCRGPSDAIPMRSCTECAKPYESYLTECPYCAHVPIPAGRGTPEQVEGDLQWLDTEALRVMYAEQARIDGPAPTVSDTPTGLAIVRNHEKRQEAQNALRHSMQLWGGWRVAEGESLREAQKRFYFVFGIDYMSAQLLGIADAWELNGRVRAELSKHNVTEVTLQ